MFEGREGGENMSSCFTTVRLSVTQAPIVYRIGVSSKVTLSVRLNNLLYRYKVLICGSAFYAYKDTHSARTALSKLKCDLLTRAVTFGGVTAMWKGL